MNEAEMRIVAALESMALSLNRIEEYARMTAAPTDDELRERLQRSISMALFMDAEKADGEPLN